MFRIHYKVTLSYDVLTETADFIFNIEAARTPRQTIISEHLSVPSHIRRDIYEDPLLKNRVLRIRAPEGPLEVEYEAIVHIDQRFDDPSTLTEIPVAQLPFNVLPYLAPSRYCQSDRLMEFALREFGAVPMGYARVLAISRWVSTHVRFLSSSSNENTSALDTLVQRTGVCRDFANLMIALCRAISVPARFCSSLDYGADPILGPSDFHAFVEVYLSGRWYLFDPSGGSIPTGLIRIGTGHDASDIPFAAIFGGVRYLPPVISVMAEANPAQGWYLPERTASAICTWQD
jgi:transglutaminase-like putative cysteine protease